MVIPTRASKGFTYVLLALLRRTNGALVTAASLYAMMWLYNIDANEAYQALIIISALIALILFRGSNAETDDLPPRFRDISLSVAGRWCLLLGVLLLLGYATKTSSIFSRRALFTWFLVAPLLLAPTQLLISSLISRLLLSTENVRRVIIAGAGDLGHQLALKIQSSLLTGMKVEGFFDDRSMERLANGTSLPLLGNLKELPDYVRSHGTDLIFVALPLRNIQRVTDLLDQLHDTTASIYFVPDVFVFDLVQCRTSQIDGMPIVALCETPFQGTRGVVKALSDYVFASIVLVLVSPIMVAIAIAIKLTSRGSVIFKQRRYGLDGREIIVYKFRSMTVSEDADHVRQATRNDSRVTKVGAFLRKYSLDELPQLINVLQGRMSIVGPRPHAVAHNEEYRSLIKGYMVRHKVNPGITGLAQVMGYRGETATVDSMQKRVEYDLKYLRNWSLGLDLKIILRTFLIVLNDKMAF
jgi:putative colanic acid biosynthesis UDP-glucose lipid carrier transferase